MHEKTRATNEDGSVNEAVLRQAAGCSMGGGAEKGAYDQNRRDHAPQEAAAGDSGNKKRKKSTY